MDRPFTQDNVPGYGYKASYTLRSGRRVFQDRDNMLWLSGGALSLDEAAALGVLATSRPEYKAQRR